MESPVDEIKKKIDIIDFIGSFITLKKTGRNFRANCPFHSEKTPSFIVSPERQIWHCFGSCGEGGDIIKFLMKWENITFPEALRELAHKAGVTLKNITLEDRDFKKKERYFNMNLLASEFFEYILNKTKFGEKAKHYLKERAINDKIAEKFRLGYSPDSWDSLRLFLKRKKFEEEEMSENGLLVKSDRGSYYDRFRGRLMFPLMDSRDRVMGFSGRTLNPDSKEAKYVNTPETPIYHKRETLFGINHAVEAIKKEKNVYVVEGEFDMITPYQKGFTNFVAVKGSALTAEQLMLLKRYTPKLTMVFDSDAAGGEAAKRGITEAEKLDMELAAVHFDFAKDPDEAARTDEVAFKKAITNPQPIYDFLLDQLIKKYSLTDPFGKKKIGDELMPYIERIGNPIVKSHYVKKLSQLLDVTESSLESLMARIRRKKKQSESYHEMAKKNQAESREEILEKYILSFIFQSESPYKPLGAVLAIMDINDLIIPSHRQIVEKLRESEGEFKNSFNLDKFVSRLEAPLKSIFDELYLFAASDVVLPGENIEKLAQELKRFSLKRQINAILAEEGRTGEKDKKLQELTSALKEVEKKIVSL